MKILGWMHRKFRQNSGDGVKDFPSGPTCNCLSGGPSLDDHHQLSPVLPARAHGWPMRDRLLSAADETLLFEGLLSIGTLGSVPIEEEARAAEQAEAEPEIVHIQESAAAAAAAAEVEAIAEKEEGEAATEMDLMLVNTELEKVLTEAAEREWDGCRLSSARPSHVSGGGRGNEACPLQEYLFGSAVEDRVSEKERKEKRASLGELFMIDEVAGAGRGGGAGGEETAKAKKGEEEGKGVNVMMKKLLLKKSGSHGNSKRAGAAATAAGGAPPPVAAKDATDTTARFQKILQIFHRKIYPENDVESRKITKSSKHKSKRATSACSGSNCFVGGGGDSLMTPSERTCRKGNKCGSDQPSLSLDRSVCTSSREHWIKTDADYLVLEL